MIDVREFRLALDDDTDVAATLHAPSSSSSSAAGDATSQRPVLLLPGARGDHGAAHLVALAEQLARAGHPVLCSALSSRPPGAGFIGSVGRSVERLRSILRAARHLLGATPDDLVIGGASYGGRVASLALAQHGAHALGVSGLLLIAYPLHPPGRPERLRVEHWPDIDVPTFMLSGDADPFLTVELLERHAADLAGPLTRVLVAGARHDLSVSSRSAPDGRRRTPAEVVAEHAATVRSWLAELPGKRVVGH